LFAPLGLVGCPEPETALQDASIARGTLNRTFHFYVPTRYDSSDPLPLVVVLHRFTESGPQMAAMTGFNEVAEREGFIVVYPEAILRTYNAFMDTAPSDAQYVLAVVDEMERRFSIDPARRYLTGASNGGFLTYRLLAEAPGVFAAAAPTMATLPVELAAQMDPADAIPVLLIHGTADPIVRYDAEIVFAGRFVELYDAPGTAAFFAERNGCGAAPEQKELPDIVPGDDTTVVVSRYEGCGEASVVAYTVVGGGHTWPGGNRILPRIVTGKMNQDFDATETIWGFFEQFRLETGGR
jgi:polyhydroxybutyrate depolymerase